MTEQERNKRNVLRFYDQVWNSGKYEVASEIFATAPDGRHDHGTVGPNSGEIQARIAKGFRMLFPDKALEINNNRDDLSVFHQLGLIPDRDDLFAKLGGKN